MPKRSKQSRRKPESSVPAEAPIVVNPPASDEAAHPIAGDGEAAASWPDEVVCFEKFGDGNCGVYAVEQWVSDPNHAERRLPSGKAFYKAKHAEEHAEMLLLRNRMARGFTSLPEDEQNAVIGALRADTGDQNLGADDVIATMRKDGCYVTQPGLLCLARDIGHPILTLQPNRQTGRWYEQLHGGEENPDAFVIGLLYNGNLGPAGHYRLISDAWLAEHMPAAGLGHLKARPVSAKFQAHKAITDTIGNYTIQEEEVQVVADSRGPVSAGYKPSIPADGDAAEIREPTVPRPRNQRQDWRPPSRKRRSDGAHLEEERRWWVQGKATDPVWGQLRQESLSDRMAQIYWQRSMLLVAAVDKGREVPACHTMFEDLQTGYLTIANLRLYFVDVVADTLIAGQRAVSKAYLDAQEELQRSGVGICVLETD